MEQMAKVLRSVRKGRFLFVVTHDMELIEKSVKKIELGQKTGVFREGDAYLLSVCFWTAVQGLMEEMAYNEELQPPDTEWLMAILRK